MLIGFDLDGTLTDLSHRLHFIKPSPLLEGKFKPDWESFHMSVQADAPIIEMVALCNDLIEAGNFIVFASGRSDICREATLQWLHKHIQLSIGEMDKNLYMRKEGDYRPDYSAKLDMLVRIMADWGKKPDLVFDDRQQVVDMWRAQGIRCLQCAKGNF